MKKDTMKKKALLEKMGEKALPDAVMDIVAGGRDLYVSEDLYFNAVYDKLSSANLLTDDEVDNMMAYLFCIDNLVDNSPEFYYNMKADYRKVWEQQTGRKWKTYRPR